MSNVKEVDWVMKIRKNLSLDFKHKFAFWWSVVGLFAREGIAMVVRGNSSGVRGLVSGLMVVLKNNKEYTDNGYKGGYY